MMNTVFTESVSENEVLFNFIPYSAEHASVWDHFVITCPMATFLHLTPFWTYHQWKFKDCSYLIYDEKQTLIALWCAAESPSNPQIVISHPGLSYGGLLHQGNILGEKMIQVIEALKSRLTDQGYHHLRYKAIPLFYHQRPSQDDLYALSAHNASRVRMDLSAVIDLQHRPPWNEKRTKNMKQAMKQGLEIKRGKELLPLLWPILSAQLTARHGAAPVHSIEEITLLVSRFPDNIEVLVGFKNEVPLCGIVLFKTEMATHLQYSTTTPEGMKIAAMDVLMEQCILEATSAGKRYFDFGTSNGQDGDGLNVGLYRFKTKFGASGMLCETYEMSL